MSIFSRDPICKTTCRYCRCQPCNVGVEHDDHTCYSCEQRLLHPGGVPGAPWRPPLTPGCESWCAHCTSQPHKSCGVFQVSVEGHWTYSGTYVLVLRVSLRLFYLDCRYPRDQLQPARKKKMLTALLNAALYVDYMSSMSVWIVSML